MFEEISPRPQLC